MPRDRDNHASTTGFPQYNHYSMLKTHSNCTGASALLNTGVLKELLTDPELRQQVLRMVKRKFEADASTFEANAYLVRQLIKLVRRSGNGTAAAGALRDVIKQYLDFSEILVNRQFEFNKALMEKLQALTSSAAPAPTTVTMNLSAAPGATVKMPFRLENAQSTSISVAFETSAFISEDGGQRVTAEIAFDPPSLELQSKQEARIELILQVGDQFKPNTTYLATVTVLGLDAPQLLVRLDVQPSEHKSATSPPTARGTAAETAVADSTLAKSPHPPKPKTRAARRTKPSQAKPSQAKHSQAKHSQAKPSRAKLSQAKGKTA